MLHIKDDNKFIVKNKQETQKQPSFPMPLSLTLQYSISLSNLRIIQKHLVYVIGLSEEMANNDVLGKYEYFGQYGTILKIAVNKSKVYNKTGSSTPNYSGYISYSLEEEASLAILVIDNFQCGDYLLRASYGTTKYCSFFLKGSSCPNKDCLYYHIIANEEDIIYKEDMNSSSNVFYQQQRTAMRICNVYSNETKSKLKLLSPMNKKTIFPVPYSIYQKEIVIKNDSILKTPYKNGIKHINLSNQNYLQSKNSLKPIEALEYSTQLSSDELISPSSTTTPTSIYFHSKIATVKSIREKTLMPSSLITFENIKIPEHKRLTFSNINHCSNNYLFRKHKESRFDFASRSQETFSQAKPVKEEENKYNKDETVPNYVSDLIGITLSRFSFFKQFNNFNSNETEQLLCNTFCYHQRDAWSQFILTNINNNKVGSQ